MTSYHYRFLKELHLFSILAHSADRRVNGCLQVWDGAQTWMLFLENGQLVYASSSVDPLERLDRYLRRLSRYLPALASPIRVQVRRLFDNPIEGASPCRDYQAICWLVDQQYLTAEQAGELIEILAKDVLENLLPLQSGSHDLVEPDGLGNLPRFCALDLRSLLESCHVKPLRLAALAHNSVTSHMPIQPMRVSEPSSRLMHETVSPLKPATAFPNPAAMPGLIRPDSLSPRLHSKFTYTIACIDDSPTVLSAIETFLDNRAFKVIRIENPVSALMTVIRNKPDLILLDVTTPGFDGYELCSLLRRHPAFKQTPVILVTRNRGFTDRAKAKLVGASGHITKPFTQPDLLKIIFKHLD